MHYCNCKIVTSIKETFHETLYFELRENQILEDHRLELVHISQHLKIFVVAQ